MRRYVQPGSDARVSVVMPHFNHGAFIDEAIESLRSQSYPPHEIIVVDDGSTDRQSLEVLERLEVEGVVVLHQEQVGPGASRNRGVEHSSGEAILFLDSDDRVTGRHIEVGLDALRSAPEEVGFVYPDLQFFGNEQQLVVMPPYNLYLLLLRNFCSMGGLVDRAVFDAGHRFRADLVDRHEDWDFFITLGISGIYGAPFHGAPLLYRRWGFSRSDGVQAAWMHEVQSLHPELDSERLIEIKREWAPALSIVLLDESSWVDITEQTCDDFEVVQLEGAAAPRLRGRFVMLLDGKGMDLLRDNTFVERTLRLLAEREPPTVVTIYRSLSSGRVWTRVTHPEEHDRVGVVMDGVTYDRWREQRQPATGGLDSLLEDSVPLVRAGDHLVYGRSSAAWAVDTGAPWLTRSRPRRMARIPPPAASSEGEASADLQDPWLPERLDRLGSEVERTFRHHEAQVLFIPAGGFRQLPDPPGGHQDGLEAIRRRAWSDWMPARSVRLDLVVDAFGRPMLETFDGRADSRAAQVSRRTTRSAIGWLWSQPFPGTVGLFSRIDLRTHVRSYYVADQRPETSDDIVVGYAAREMLPGRISLRQSLHELSRIVDVQDLVDLSQVAGDAFLESMTQFRRTPSLLDSGAASGTPRLWPLYEIEYRNGTFRYSCEPDLCVSRDDVRRPFPNVVAEVAQHVSSGTTSPLYEAQVISSGQIGYFSQLELVASGRDLKPLRVVGGLQTSDNEAVPLVRLKRDGTPPGGDLGHRLATSWRAVVRDGYTPEGVIGFARRPDAARAPLYRWWDAARGTWHLSLGDDAVREIPYLDFEGTLGSAWTPTASGDGYADLWEMERDGARSYTTDPAALEPLGYLGVRIVARLLREQRPGSVPLFSLASDRCRSTLVTTCREERPAPETPECTVLGYLEAAIPVQSTDILGNGQPLPEWAVGVQLSDGAGGSAEGLLFRDRVAGGVEAWANGDEGWLAHLGPRPPADSSVTLLGFALRHLLPYGRPVYEITRTGLSATTLAAGTPYRVDGIVRGVAGFLPGTLSELPEEATGVGSGARPTKRRTGGASLTRGTPGSLRNRLRRFMR